MHFGRRSDSRSARSPVSRASIAPLVLGIAVVMPWGARLEAAETMHIRGRVWNDVIANGAIDEGEEGMAGVWVGLTTERGDSVVAHGLTDRRGRFDIELPTAAPAGVGRLVECVPPAGHYPTTPTRHRLADASGAGAPDLAFGVHRFQRIALNAPSVEALASGDLVENDWGGHRVSDARQDADLIAGGRVADVDRVSVWFNHFDNQALFTSTRDYSRAAPSPVLCMAVEPAIEDRGPRRTLDVVTGTTPSEAGNFFVWTTQATECNEGYLPGRYGIACTTADAGDVQAVRIGDFTGLGAREIVVGTRSPDAVHGTIELWRADPSGRRAFSRVEVHPRAGEIPSEGIGEVTALAAGRLAGARSALVVGTRTGPQSGQLLLYRAGEAGSETFRLQKVETFDRAAVLAIACADYDLDGRIDVIVAAATGPSTGEIQLWKNVTLPGGDSLVLTREATVPTRGVPISIACADLGGAPNPDLVVGLRDDVEAWKGSVRVYYLDGGVPPTAPVDPYAGRITGMVSALLLDDFNQGSRPARSSGPRLTDIVAAERTGPATGSLVVLIR